jgi:hypothetical protein
MPATFYIASLPFQDAPQNGGYRARLSLLGRPRSVFSVNADEQGVGKASVVNGRLSRGLREHSPAPLSGAAARLPAAR